MDQNLFQTITPGMIMFFRNYNELTGEPWDSAKESLLIENKTDCEIRISTNRKLDALRTKIETIKKDIILNAKQLVRYAGDNWYVGLLKDITDTYLPDLLNQLKPTLRELQRISKYHYSNHSDLIDTCDTIVKQLKTDLTQQYKLLNEKEKNADKKAESAEQIKLHPDAIKNALPPVINLLNSHVKSLGNRVSVSVLAIDPTTELSSTSRPQR